MKLIMYILAIMGAILIIFLLFKIFKFEKEDNTKYPKVTDEEVAKLYNFFPKENYNPGSTFYLDSYVPSNNLSYTLISLVTYNYIKRTYPEKIEQDKIDTKYFLEMSKYLFGETNFYVVDFKIDKNTSAKVKGDYLYLYEDNNTLQDNIVYYKDMDSYTLENDNETLIIYEYFLKCNTLTKECFDTDGNNEIKNNYITYSENLDINNYKDKLKYYEHTFTYKDNHYVYVSTK